MSLEEINKQIEQEGYQKFPPRDDGYDPFCHERDSWVVGAMAYATRAITAEENVKILEQWKQESIRMMNPIMEWGHAQKDIPLGSSITSEVLRRAKMFTEMENEVDRLRKALKLITINNSGEDMRGIALRSLNS